jgi:putative hydrolase of the HAD superfamily
MPESKPHQVVSFDIWSTLLKSNPDYKQARAVEILNALGNPTTGMEPLDFLESVDNEIDATSDINGKQYGFAERVSIVAEKAGVNPLDYETMTKLHQGQLELVKQYPPKLIEPNLPQILEPLAFRKRLAVVSNTGFIDGHIMRGALDRLDVLNKLSIQIFSNEVGFSKPSREIFGELLAQAGVAPPEVIHIGDNPRSMGMDAVHLAKGIRIAEALEQVRY